MESIKKILTDGKQYTISVNGKKAVDIASHINSGKCYSALKINGQFAGQIEVTIDDDGMYNGRPNKWVDISFIPSEMVFSVIAWLTNNGFSGCFAYIAEESGNGDELVFSIPEQMQNSNIINHGDKISAMGFTFMVDQILYQAYWDGDGFDCEFKDSRGNYHHWKQWEDKGNLFRWNGRQWQVIS